MGALFVTGASGFIGRTLLEKLDPGEFDQINLLSRGELQLPANLVSAGNVEVVRASIFNAEVYSPYLKDGGTLVHLAAVTGKARESDYFNVNTEGTRLLLGECRKAGIARFLYASSIAVNFSNIEHYPYARSKVLAEAAVKESGIGYTIVRPTIVIGRNAPILNSLSALGKLPIVPMFGNGETRIQPIWVGDLADCLMSILSQPQFCGDTHELGGPEVVSIEDFVLAVRELGGKTAAAKVVRLPLSPLTAILQVLERMKLPLPLSAAQLSSFGNDGIAKSNPVHQQHAPSMKTVREMLAASISG